MISETLAFVSPEGCGYSTYFARLLKTCLKIFRCSLTQPCSKWRNYVLYAVQVVSSVVLHWWSKTRYIPTISVETHCRIRLFCCSLNCSGCFLSERQTKLTDGVRSTYSSDSTKARLGTIKDILLFCEVLTRLFNRISVDKTVCNCILMRDIIIIFTVRNQFVVCVCYIVKNICSWVIGWGSIFKCWLCNFSS